MSPISDSKSEKILSLSCTVKSQNTDCILLVLQVFGKLNDALVCSTQKCRSQSKYRKAGHSQNTDHMCVQWTLFTLGSSRCNTHKLSRSWKKGGTSHVCFSKEDAVLPASPQEDFSKVNFPPDQLQGREAWFWRAKKCRSMSEQCHCQWQCHTEQQCK